MLQVWLPGLYVGRIAVGMHHAAALAEPLDQRSAPPQVRPADPLLGSLCPCTQQSVTQSPPHNVTADGRMLWGTYEDAKDRVRVQV